MIGTGYVGLVSGACLADFGNAVHCVDIDENADRAASLRRDSDLRTGPQGAREPERGQRRLRFTTDIAEGVAGSDVVFIAVGTPSRPDGSADLSQVFNVVESISQAPQRLQGHRHQEHRSRGDHARDRRASCGPRRRADAEFDVVANPEFLREGSAVEDFMRPNRVVIGAETETVEGPDEKGVPPALSHRDADSHHRSRDGGARQAREQRVSRDQDLVHQRDRGDQRARRRQHRRRVQGDGARRPDRIEVPPRGRRFRRIVSPEGHILPHAHRVLARVRAAIVRAIFDLNRQASRAGRSASSRRSWASSGERRSAFSVSRSSRTPTISATPRRSASSRVFSTKGRGCECSIPWRWTISRRPSPST